MSNLAILISLSIAVLGFLFLFWRRLKEDYPSEQIFTFGFIVVGFILTGFSVGLLTTGLKTQNQDLFYVKNLWFWFSFLFGAIGFFVSFFKLRLRFFETLEATGLGFLFLCFAISVINAIQTVDIKLLFFSLFQLFLIFFFFFVDARYKNLSWYKSGKVGFSGLLTLALFFLVRAIVALIDPHMLSFVGKIDAIISILVSFIFFASLYNLSEQ